MKITSRLAAVLTKLAKSVGEFLYLTEELIALPVEFVWETYFRFDPRLYSEQLRVRTATAGSAHKASNKFAVFVVYAKSTVPDFTIDFIEALNRASYNLIIVSNVQLDAATKVALLDHCSLLVERSNFGRDFGAYKDGISAAFQHYQKIEKLIIANDSVYYLKPGLDRLIAALDGPEDFIGVSEVFQHHYHVASFLLSFGPRVIADPAFRQFWAWYRPIPTRMWAIIKGEGELTRRLIDAGHRPHVLFPAQSLLPILRQLSAAEFRDTLALFPTEIRQVLSPLAEHAPAGAAAVQSEYAAAAIKEVMERNQMHAAGFAFMKFLGLPLFKRDIVYRELFSLQDAARIVADLAAPMQDQIMADLARRSPPPSRFNVLRRLLYRHGYV